MKIDLGVTVLLIFLTGLGLVLLLPTFLSDVNTAETFLTDSGNPIAGVFVGEIIGGILVVAAVLIIAFLLFRNT